MDKYIRAWINKYVFKIQSPSTFWMGYPYEWDYLMHKAKRSGKK